MKIEEIHFQSGEELFVEKRIVEATFDEWIEYIFNREKGETHWTFGEQNIPWQLPAQLTAEYVAQTFEESQLWRGKFSTKQIADGLDFTWNTCLGGISSVFVDGEIPWRLRKRLIMALIPLYRDCFQKFCQPGLGHLSECSENPLNTVCYMLWDVCPLHGQPEDLAMAERDDECLRVMDQTLQIDHDACRESALHGLGHWARAYPSRVNSIITQGLKTVRKQLRLELLSYAERAQVGKVL